MGDDKDEQLSEDEIQRRMDNAIRRALSTPPKPTKQLVGKTERAKSQRKSKSRIVRLPRN
jgi:hypothetical protein